jgi:hypothetical protein
VDEDRIVLTLEGLLRSDEIFAIFI